MTDTGDLSHHTDAVIEPARPTPSHDEATAEFWALAAQGQLATSRCRECGWRAYPPRAVCVICFADPPVFEWTPVSGDGRLATWTVVRDAMLPGFAALVPYVVGEIELVEQVGLRMVARVVDIDPGELAIGLPMQVGFVEDDSGHSIPVFTAAPS